MSLDYDLTKCVGGKDVMSDEEWPITHSLIWLTISTGIGDLSEKNAPEFYARVKMLEKMDGKDAFYTPEMIRKRIGMTTNVFPMDTRAKWAGKVLKYDMERAVNEFNKEV
jgi:hypothetical protein